MAKSNLTRQQKQKAHGMALLAAGMAPDQIMEILGVTERSVQRWCKESKEKGCDLTNIVANAVAEKKEEKFVEALEKYMEQAFVTFTRHLEYASNEEWFKEQEPDKVAVFDGVHADKVFQVLDAIAEHQRNRDDK